MKSILNAIIMGICLFISHCIFAKLYYSPKDVIDLNESEVKELE